MAHKKLAVHPATVAILKLNALALSVSAAKQFWQAASSFVNVVPSSTLALTLVWAPITPCTRKRLARSCSKLKVR